MTRAAIPPCFSEETMEELRCDCGALIQIIISEQRTAEYRQEEGAWAENEHAACAERTIGIECSEGCEISPPRYIGLLKKIIPALVKQKLWNPEES